MDQFTRAYVHAAAFTQDPHPGSGEYTEPDHTELDPAFLGRAIADCAEFLAVYRADLDELSDTFHVTDDQHGHDFWLSRNGHGAGFWDRGYDVLLPDVVKRVEAGCDQFGVVDDQVFADGRDLVDDQE